MKVHRRGASSPSMLLEASEPPTSVNVNGNYYQFELEPHHVERGKRGQKVFVCDLCPAPGGVFKRSFSLKRHYLRFHINFAFLSPRDLNNCAIAVAGQHQRSGFPPTGPNDRLINRFNNPSPLIFRCHQCGRLVKTKNDLLKHLKAHPGPSQTVTEEVGSGDRQHGGTNRCPRCSTAFSLRKTLMRHIKKNRCRGGNPPTLPGIPDPRSKPELETGIQSGETSDPGHDYLAMGPEEESEEMDIEASLRLGCPTSLFRFSCTLCNKMFNSYVNMCRHRRLAHGRYGICSPHWLLSRKLSSKPSLKHAVQSPISSSRNFQSSYDLSHIVNNANDNLNQFIDGKRNHIRSVAPIDDRFEVQPTDGGDPPPERWSWGETNYNTTELQKLDVPLQMAYYNGLKSLKLQESAKLQCTSSQASPEEVDFSKVLNLRIAETLSSVEVTTVSQPEFSGEWIRSKNYICSPCGEIFQDFLVLLDHQQNDHNGVWCTHVQLDQSTEPELADELKRQIMRSGNGGPTLPLATFQCTKCHFSVESIPELHSHILLCSNHVSASPYRKRRIKVNPRSRRSHWNGSETSNGGSRCLQRTNSSQMKNPVAVRSLRSRSPKEDTDKISPGTLRRSTRRVLSFSEPVPMKKKNCITKRNLRQRVDPPQINGSAVSKSIQSEVKEKSVVLVNAKSTSKTTVDQHECDGCQKQFKSHSSVLKHKHYCPKKLTESYDVFNHTSTPVSSSKNQNTGSSKAKVLVYESDKTEGILGRSITKRKPEVLSSSPIKKSKITVSNANGSHTSNFDSPKKISRKSVSSSPPTHQVSSGKTSTKPKASLKSIADPINSSRSAGKNGCKKENREMDKIKVASEGRPVRSSRRLSMTLVMEDQVEASFLEALSPEQRVRVAEQKCPFCSKHYVYRSNFKRHLLEGCDTIDVDEPSVNLTPINNKKPSEEKKSSLSSVLTTERKEKRETFEKNLNVGSKLQKKKNFQIEEIEKIDEKIVKATEKKSEKTLQNFSKSAKLHEFKKSSETSSRKKAVQLVGEPQQSIQKAKQIHSKKLEVQQNKNGKTFGGENTNNVTRVKWEENMNCEKFELLRRNGRKPTFVQKSKKSTSSELTDQQIKAKSSDLDLDTNNALDLQLEKTTNKIQDDGQIGDSKEKIGVNHLTVVVYKDDEPKGNLPHMNGCLSSKIFNGNCSSNRELRSSTIYQYHCNQSQALDRLKLGQALENAINGMFKSYTYLTKYPIQIRLLKNMSQAYLQPDLQPANY